MSANSDSEETRETSTTVDNVVVVGGGGDDDVGVNSESTNNQEFSSREANYDSNNSNDDGVMVSGDNNGSGGDSDGVVVYEDAGREDMFLDAPEDLGADGRDSSATLEAQGSTDGDDDGNRHQTQFRGLDNEMQNDYMVDEMERLRAMLDKTINEKESIEREYKDEMDMAAKGITNLRDQMRDLIDKQLLLDQRNYVSIDHFHRDAEQMPLHEMIHECSTLLKNFTEEVQDLNRKSTEAVVSRQVVDSYINSVQNESAEVQFQKDQYVEDVMNRMLSSFASVVYVGDLLDGSVAGKIAHVEKSVFTLIENYNWFLYQTDQLRHCMTEVRPDLIEQTDYGVIFAAADDELLGFRKKEADFVEKLSHLETDNSTLMKQLDKHKAAADTLSAELDKHKAAADTLSAELEKLKAELEQEKHRYSNTKEKLSLAVTKGKALVQQRDSLKQAIADKTTELDNCLVELKEKSTALEAAESIKEELLKSQILSTSLQEILVQKDLIIEELENILLQSGVPEGLKSKDVADKIRWLVDERNALKDVSLKFHQLADALLSIDLPENFSFSDLESRLGWLTESFDQAKAEIGTLQNELTHKGESLNHAKAEIDALQDENVRIWETASDKINHLTAMLSTVLVEKDYVTVELEDMSRKFEELAQREKRTSTEKEHMLRILMEASGVTVEGKEPSETALLVEQCLTAIKEKTGSIQQSSGVQEETLESFQMMLYVKNQDLIMYENLLEEEMQKKKIEIDNLFSDLRKASEEIAILKEEKETLKKDLERTEDKSALIREKLSMAVKKGKGLVQERDNLRQIIDEKNSEMEKLNNELQQKELAISEYKNENSRLSVELQGMAKLEEDLLGLRDQRDQLERNLLESNKLFQTLVDSVNNISLPADSSFEDPVEKLLRLGGYLSDSQASKAQTEQQLEKAMVEVDLLSTKVSECLSTIKSLEDALTVAEEKIYQLSEEKRELENGRTSVEEQLQRAMEEAGLLAEADAAKRSLENALALAESKISDLNREKEEAESNGAASEAEVHTARAEIIDLTGKLSEATTTVKKLEDTVSQLETRISELNDENNEAQIGRNNTDNELKKLKEEADTWDSKLQDAYSTIKSLEEALAKAESGITGLVNDKKAMEQEMSTLNAKLNEMEGLAGTSGSLESRSLELFDHLKDLELLWKDEMILTSLRKWCETVFESLKEMDILFRNIRNQFAEMVPENQTVLKEPTCFRKLLETDLDDIVRMDSVSSHADAVEGDDISLFAQKMVKSFQMAKKSSAEKLDGFFSFLNECNASVMQELHSTSNLINPIVEKMNSQNQEMKSMESEIHVLENGVTSLEDEVAVLLSACHEATGVLQFEIDNRMPEINSSFEQEAAYEKKFHESKHVEAVEKLLSAGRKVCTLCDLFENSRNMLSSRVEELQSNLNEVKATAQKTMEESELYKNKIHELETDIAALQNLCSELRVKLENYGEIEINLRDKDKKISSLQDTLMMREREAGEALHRASQLEILLERVNDIPISEEDLQPGNLEPHDSAHIKKLHYAIDNYPQMQHRIESLSQENEELQTALAAQLHEMEHLKEQLQHSISHEQELAKVERKVIDMEASLERIIQELTRRDMIGDPKRVSYSDRVHVLEKLVMNVISEAENLKSRVHELESQIESSQSNELELAMLKDQLLDLEAGTQRIIQNLGGDVSRDQKPVATSDLIQVLEKLVMTVISECEKLKSKANQLDIEVGRKLGSEQELAQVKVHLFDIEAGVQRIIQKLRGNVPGDQKPVATSDLVQVLENMVTANVMESENSRYKVQELESKLLGSQKAVDELSSKVKALESSLHSRAAFPDTVQERSIFEAPSQPSASEISEIEDAGAFPKPTISPVPSSAHVRTTWKGSSDHIALNVDTETSRLTDSEAVEDKGHVFKSLNTSGLVPKQGKVVADRIDGIWVNGDRLLRNRPGARLGLIAYWLFLHIWLLGSIL